MESSNSKAEMVKPFLMKAGIPLAVALGGFLFAKVVTRKSTLESQVNIHKTDSSNRNGENEIDRSCEMQQEITALRSRIEDVQDRERLETRFLCYQHLKDQEMSLMELQNKLLMELNGVELFRREISLLGVELHRFEYMVMEYLKVSGLLKISISGNRKLHKRVVKLLRIIRDNYRVLRKQNLQIEAKEADILRNEGVIEVKDDCMRKMKDENKELKLTTEQLKVENNQLLHDLNIAEKSTTQKVEKETFTKEKYVPFESKWEHGKDEADEIYEVMYLRRCNAFLKHELMRKNQEQEEDQMHEEDNHLDTNSGQITEIEEYGSDNEFDRLAPDDPTKVHVHRKRLKLIAKFKKWVEGVEKTKPNSDEKEKHENKYFWRHSVSDGKELS